MRRGRRLGQVVPVAADTRPLDPNAAAPSSATFGRNAGGSVDLDSDRGGAPADSGFDGGAGGSEGRGPGGRGPGGPGPSERPSTGVGRSSSTGLSSDLSTGLSSDPSAGLGSDPSTGLSSGQRASYVGKHAVSPRHAAAPRHADEPSLLADLSKAALAGARATVPMTAVLVAGQVLTRYGELPPRLVTRRGLDLLGLQPSPPTRLALTAVNHLTFGAIVGAGYGLLRHGLGISDRSAPVAGAAYAAGVYATSYGGWLPLLGLSPALWQDNRRRQVTLLLAHLVFGARVASGLRTARH